MLTASYVFLYSDSKCIAQAYRYEQQRACGFQPKGNFRLSALQIADMESLGFQWKFTSRTASLLKSKSILSSLPTSNLTMNLKDSLAPNDQLSQDSLTSSRPRVNNGNLGAVTTRDIGTGKCDDIHEKNANDADSIHDNQISPDALHESLFHNNSCNGRHDSCPQRADLLHSMDSVPLDMHLQLQKEQGIDQLKSKRLHAWIKKYDLKCYRTILFLVNF